MRPEVLGLIPARGGSKGVPLKNRRLVAGRPLIAYSIDAARQSNRLTQIAVTTDDPAIADIARSSGVDVVMRPEEIAGDTSPVIDAVRHAIQVRRNQGIPDPQALVLLQPTAPLRTGADIDAAVELFFSGDGHPVCSVSRCEDNHPARMYRLDDKGRLTPLMPELASLRRQDLPAVFHRNGALYIVGPREIAAGVIISPSMTPYVMEAQQSLNVDTEFDLRVLDVMLSKP